MSTYEIYKSINIFLEAQRVRTTDFKCKWKQKNKEKKKKCRTEATKKKIEEKLFNFAGSINNILWFLLSYYHLVCLLNAANKLEYMLVCVMKSGRTDFYVKLSIPWGQLDYRQELFLFVIQYHHNGKREPNSPAIWKIFRKR